MRPEARRPTLHHQLIARSIHLDAMIVDALILSLRLQSPEFDIREMNARHSTNHGDTKPTDESIYSVISPD